MGSTGTGNFSDYSQKANTGNQGGSSNKDKCASAFSAMLEDVDRCDYYKHHSSLPPLGEAITIELKKRLTAVTSAGEIIGYLPTSYNYLAQCMGAGFVYQGSVVQTKSTPILTVQIDVAPI
jgi:hypothetical protein